MADRGYLPPPDGQADRERDDLVALMASAGWKLFCDHVADLWNDAATLERVGLFAGQSNVDKQRESAGQILAGRQAVHAVMSWPQTRVHALTTPVTARTSTRPHRRARV